MKLVGSPVPGCPLLKVLRTRGERVGKSLDEPFETLGMETLPNLFSRPYGRE
jgi:hypothetical protein